MLRRVVVENYIIFKGRQELHFCASDGGSFYTLVGENASGKSSFVALVKAASNLVDNDSDFEVIGDGAANAKAVCEFRFKDGEELSQYFQRPPSTSWYLSLYHIPWVAGFFSWFSEDVLKIPKELSRLVKGTFGNVRTPISVFAGRRNFTSVRSPCPCQFVYIVCNDVVLVVVKRNKELATAFHDPLPAGVDVMDWSPDESFLREVKVDLLLDDRTVVVNQPDRDVGSSLVVDPSDPLSNQSERLSAVLDGRDAFRYRDAKNLVIANLLKDLSRNRVDDALSLFREIMGDKSLAFELHLHGDSPIRITETRTNQVLRHLSEGMFSAFVVSALVVHPYRQTVIFDEASRGMHPLQIRRLRTILTRESRNKGKCIITTTHSPEMLEVERITLIWRFQVLPSGYCQIRRVTSRYSVRDLHFIGGAEVREIFFARYIVWVEGESDKRFIEALLRLFDEGNTDLWNALLRADETRNALGGSTSPRSVSSWSDLSRAIENLCQDPAYERKYYSRDVLTAVQEAVRSTIVLSLSGKKNVYKATAICNDLGIPYAVICDLDVIIPNSRENSVQSQFDCCRGLWNTALIPHSKTKLLDEEECPACKCVQDSDPGLVPRLRACRTVGEVMKFYNETQRIFTWRVNGGEIEDAVRLTRSQFGKKLWPEMSFEDVKNLVICLLYPRKLRERNPKDRDATRGANPEVLRCIFFLIRFFRERKTTS